MTKTITLEKLVQNCLECWQGLVTSCHFQQSPPRETQAEGRQTEVQVEESRDGQGEFPSAYGL